MISIEEERDLSLKMPSGTVYNFHPKETDLIQNGGSIVKVRVWPMLRPRTYDQTLDEMQAEWTAMGLANDPDAGAGLAKMRAEFGSSRCPRAAVPNTPYVAQICVRPMMSANRSSHDAVWFTQLTFYKKSQ